MKLPNWARVGWWAVLTLVVTRYLWVRYPQLAQGNAVPADIVVFVIWVALLLAPLFAEVSLLGITLKQQVDDLKTSMANQLADFRNEVRNAVDVRTTFSNHFSMPSPPSDAQLPDLEQRIKSAIREEIAVSGVQVQPPPSSLPVTAEVGLLFAARYNIEKELRRIAASRERAEESRRHAPVFNLTRTLVHEELLEPRLAQAIREVYAVCSPAIHGEDVSPAKIQFVQEVAPELVAALRAIA